jgi:anti-sigma factor (TIGR02949 family)
MAEPIDCREAKARLDDYLKRELTPELAIEVRIHIERCRSCFDQSRFEESFLRMLEERARREVCPGALRERILRALREEARQD